MEENKNYQPRENSAPANNRRVKSGVSVSGSRPVMTRIEQGKVMGTMQYVDGVLP